jgi:predicted dehydrogenase
MTGGTRRAFVGRVAGISAASYARILGANDRPGIALIGAGRRGTLVGRAFVEDGRASLRAVCDIYDVHRDRVAKLLARDGGPIATTTTHEDVLARRDVDAVIIATPDHLHVDLATAALRAGKHVYLEKPTIHRWEERHALEHAVKESGRVLQCGTQQRSGAHYLRAKDEFFDRKRLGQVVLVRAVWHDFPWQQRRIVPAPKPPGLDWDRFLGPAPRVDYDTARYDSWRYFPDYGGGLLADVLTHWADVAQWMLDDAAPVDAFAAGGIYALNDGRRNPDTVSAVVRYRNWNLAFESTVLSVRNDRPSVLFEGTEGTLDLARNGYTFTPRQGAASTVESTENLERAHAASFLNAITDGAKPAAPLESGIQAALPVQLALRSFWSGKRAGAPELISTEEKHSGE